MALGSSKSNELMPDDTLVHSRVSAYMLDKRTAKRLNQANAVPISDVLNRLGYQVRSDGGHREQQFSCDLHGDSRDKMPSGRMYPETNSTYCFACGKSRRPIDYLKDKRGMKFYEALRALEQQYNLPFIPWEEGDLAASETEVEPTFEMAQESEAVDLAERCGRLLNVACRERSIDLDRVLRYSEVLERAYAAMNEGVKPAEAIAVLTKLKDRICNTTSTS